MSLRKLLKWHKFTIQSSELAGQEASGALDRKNAWLNLAGYVNSNCHRQTTPSNKIGKDDTVMTYGKVEFELYYTFFHNNLELFNLLTPEHRILTNKQPQKTITDFNNINNILIYEVISSREPVDKPSHELLFETYTKLIFRQSL